MGRLSLGQRGALPPASYVSSVEVAGTSPFPRSIPAGSTQRFPAFSAVTSPSIDFAGYNTLSLFITLGTVPGGETVNVHVQTIDPESSVSNPIPGNLGRRTVLTGLAAAGDFATTLFLPDYYDGLAGLILPFFSNYIEVQHVGAGADIVVTTMKLWLTNTGTAS